MLSVDLIIDFLILLVNHFGQLDMEDVTGKFKTQNNHTLLKYIFFLSNKQFRADNFTHRYLDQCFNFGAQNF